MKTYLDCIPCFFRQALAAARISSEDETVHRCVLNAVALMIPDLTLNATPPVIAQQVYRIVYEITGNNDPYFEAKKIANKSAIEDSLGYQLDQVHYRKFKESIDKAYLVLYIADNAGEIVFDRILIEQLLKIKRLKIVLVVRKKPIINDATLDDALQVGLNKVATIISSGSDVPATILSQCSTKMRGYYLAADLIISKGQGNYESLSGRPENIFFLFKVKCPVIARDSGCDLDSFVLTSF